MRGLPVAEICTVYGVALPGSSHDEHARHGHHHGEHPGNGDDRSHPAQAHTGNHCALTALAALAIPDAPDLAAAPAHGVQAEVVPEHGIAFRDSAAWAAQLEHASAFRLTAPPADAFQAVGRGVVRGMARDARVALALPCRSRVPAIEPVLVCRPWAQPPHPGRPHERKWRPLCGRRGRLSALPAAALADSRASDSSGHLGHRRSVKPMNSLPTISTLQTHASAMSRRAGDNDLDDSHGITPDLGISLGAEHQRLAPDGQPAINGSATSNWASNTSSTRI
jgi:hypothetical protein